MSSPTKFLFLSTIDVILLLTLPDTGTLLAAHLPARLLWPINMHHEHRNHTAPHKQQQPLLLISGLPSHGTVSQQEQLGEIGRWARRKPEEVGIAGSGRGERPDRERRETGESWRWCAAAKPWTMQAFPSCCCFSLLCPELHTCLCKCSSTGISPLCYVATWNTGNKLNILTLTYLSFK